MAAAALVLLASPVRTGAASSAAGAPRRATGDARALSTLVRVRVGDLRVDVVGDLARAVRNGSRQALAQFVTGTAGESTLGLERREADDTQGSGSEQHGPATVAVPGMLSVARSGTELATIVTEDLVRSSVTAEIGSIDAMTGLVTSGGALSGTDIRLTASASQVDRVIDLNRVHVFAVGDLLARMGVDPLALGCAGVSDAGARLAVPAAAGACEQLAAVESAIGDARSALDRAAADLDAQRAALSALIGGRAREQVQADRDAVAALSCGALDVLCQTTMLTTLAGFAAQYGVDVSGLLPDGAKSAVLAAIDAVLAAFDALDATLADLDVVNAGIDAAARGTCGAVEGALGAVGAGVPALVADMQRDAGSVDRECDALLGTVSAVLDMPIVTLDGVHIALHVSARETDPAVEVTGTMDSVRIGADLHATAPDLPASAETLTGSVGDAMRDVVGALGLGLPRPTVELMVVEDGHGRRYDGTWYAEGAVTLLHVGFSPAVVPLPSARPLGALAGEPGIPAVTSVSPARAGGFRAAALSTPAVAFDAGVFEAQSSYTAAAAGDDPDGEAGGGVGGEDSGVDDEIGAPAPETTGGRETMPVTGVGLGIVPMGAAAAAFAGAFGVIRYLRKR